ncbi:transporter [Marinoscillum furvescens]|uniref:Outer membrane beta-barrel porin/alpha-amylase n=1 Tax=Marinoscillum furvescens DSM 4134 TaxID=1122208 RepID=A0A3D9L2Y9_MARFU|nr:transporter [Marinoscillum furvescens]RED97021.1 hypothetical protein C7460_11369 [Marinoscillum furvescens DSM 4134]
MKLLIAIAAMGMSLSLAAQELWSAGRPDGHGPISVMGDHTHNQGEWMVSYRYMYMYMDGMRSGTEDRTTEEVHADYMVSPLDMHMHMHMLGMMYAATDELTLMVMSGVQQRSMNHVTRMDMEFETASGGISDLKIGGLYKVLDKKAQRVHLNLSVSIPTGSIEETDVTPASDPDEAQLPYPMQIGSGTWDILPGVTYLYQTPKTSMGVQASGILRTGKNDRGYAFGNRVSTTLWTAYKLSECFSASLKLKGIQAGEISGGDDAYMNPMMVPTVQSENFGGTLATLGGGVNMYLPNGMLKNVRIGIEAAIPIYQNLNGLQMKAQESLTIGLQYSL